MSNDHHRLDNWPRDIVNDAGGQRHKWPKSLGHPTQPHSEQGDAQGGTCAAANI